MERRTVCFRLSGAPARPFLKGRPFLHPTFPRDKPKSGAPTLKRFCPQGKQRRIRTPAAPLAPAGQGSVIQRAAGGRLLLLSLPPSVPAPAANGTHRSLSAPCSWGRQASPRSQRHWPAAPPPHPSPPKTVAGGRPLLVGLSPSAHSTAPTETHRSRPAPCSWGGSASPRSRRHWPAALPPTAGLTREGRSRYNRDSRMMWEVLPHVRSGRPGQSGP